MRRPRDSRDLLHANVRGRPLHGQPRGVRLMSRQCQGGSGLGRITLRHNQCYRKRECAEESLVVKLSMSLRLQRSQKPVQALLIALIPTALLAACQPKHNPTPSPLPTPGPVPRVPAPTPSPEPNREPELPVTPKTTAEANAHWPGADSLATSGDALFG
jgi:hypothetical protein